MKSALNRIKQDIFEFACASVSKWVLMQNFSKGNESDLHENELVGWTYLQMNSFADSLWHRGKGNSDMAC